MAHVGVLQHFWCEPAVVFDEVLREEGHYVTSVELFNGQAVPAMEAFDAWLVMGGPMNVDDTDKYPFLSQEKTLLANLIAMDRPVLGICLGAQLIARAMGARVYPRRPKEIGMYPIELAAAAADDPLFCMMENPQEVFQWHGDTFDLPEGAVHLARSPRYENQAFRVGRRVYAIQFHIECDQRIVRQWCNQWTDEIALLSDEDRGHILGSDWEEPLKKQNELARRVILAWIGLAGCSF